MCSILTEMLLHIYFMTNWTIVVSLFYLMLRWRIHWHIQIPVDLKLGRTSLNRRCEVKGRHVWLKVEREKRESRVKALVPVCVQYDINMLLSQRNEHERLCWCYLVFIIFTLWYVLGIWIMFTGLIPSLTSPCWPGPVTAPHVVSNKSHLFTLQTYNYIPVKPK